MTIMLVQTKKCAEQRENLVFSIMILCVMIDGPVISHYLQRVT